LRREAYPEPYEALKALTRTHGAITPAVMSEFIAGLNVGDAVKAELRGITPSNYLGFASKLVRG
jgi:adenylosuccinate lyase